jgi:hypothetical protein
MPLNYYYTSLRVSTNEENGGMNMKRNTTNSRKLIPALPFQHKMTDSLNMSCMI